MNDLTLRIFCATVACGIAIYNITKSHILEEYINATSNKEEN